MEGSTGTKRATVGFAISLVAGIIILLNGIWLLYLGSIASALGELIPGLGDILGVGLTLLGGIGVVFAIIILIGAWLIYTPGREMIGGILVLVFSIISIVTGGGFIIGLILGIIGGILGLVKK